MGLGASAYITALTSTDDKNFGRTYKISPLQPLLFSSTSRLFFIPALIAPTIASALSFVRKHFKFLGVVVEKSRGGVRGFFPAGLRRPQP